MCIRDSIVTDRLSECFGDLMNYSFTATMEKRLDEVAGGVVNWKTLLNQFYTGFSANLQSAKSIESGMRPNMPSETDVSCKLCGRPMLVRTAGTGVFLSCSGYSLPPKERCKGTLNLTAGDEAINIEDDDEAESKSLIQKQRCNICNLSLIHISEPRD